jgi:flagellar basal body P-ring protein FlgI
MQWVQEPNQSNVDNLNNVRREVNINCRNKKKEHLKAKIHELESNRMTKINTNLYRGISDFKKIYKPRTNIVMDEKGGLVTDAHSILLGGVTISLTY